MDARQLTLLSATSGPHGVAAAAAAVTAALAGGPATAILPADAGPDRLGRDPVAQWDATALVLQTSGSTGEPLLVEIGADALRAAAHAGSDAVGGPGVWLTALPVTGIGGLMTVVRSVLCGLQPVAWPGVGGAWKFTDGAFAPSCLAARQTADAAGAACYTSLVPTQILRLARSGSLACLTVFDRVLIGGAALAPKLAEALGDAGVRYTQTYGATETCGGVVYDGTPLAGVSVRIAAAPSPADAAGHGAGGAAAGDGAIRTGDGVIEISGATLAHGYRGNPALTRGRFRGGWFRSGDLGRWADGRLMVLGRGDDIIKSGGQKVSLAAVEQALRGCPGVLDALVVPAPDAEWGQVPVAYVVEQPGTGEAGSLLEEQLRQAVRLRVGSAGVPRQIELVAELPEAASGKADRGAAGSARDGNRPAAGTE